MDHTDITKLLLLILLLALSAFFSACETAYSSVNKIRLRNYAKDGNPKAQRALKLADKYDWLLSTILVGNNVVNMASSSIATIVATKLLGVSGAAVATIIITVLVLIFGETLPKSLAKENSESIAMGTSGILSFVMKLLTPVVFLFVKIKDAASKLFSKTEGQPSVTEEELKYIVESIEQEGVLEEQESDLVRSALEFDEISVQEILTPRVDMIALSADASFEEALKIVIDSHHSRIPVYRQSVDQIIGVLNVHDLLKAVVEQKGKNLDQIISGVLYVHRTMKISALLAQLNLKKMHMAVVTDDYGGTLGIVTMEDILEQLVGEIWDESDEIIHDIEKLDEENYLVSGDTNIVALFEVLELEDKDFESDYNTVGGWTMEMLGHVPAPEEQFVYRCLELTVDQVKDHRVLSLRVKQLPPRDESME